MLRDSYFIYKLKQTIVTEGFLLDRIEFVITFSIGEDLCGFLLSENTLLGEVHCIREPFTMSNSLVLPSLSFELAQ